MKLASITLSALAALALSLGAAQAQAAKPAPKRKAAAKAPTSVTVTNARSAAMTGIAIQTTGDQPRIVGNYEKELASGKTLKLALKKPAGCSYNVLASFADGAETEVEGLNLCKDGKIRLTE